MSYKSVHTVCMAVYEYIILNDAQRKAGKNNGERENSVMNCTK